MSKLTVLAFGEVLWDMLPTGKILGGAPANFAFRLAQEGFDVKLISRVGKDELGTELVSELAQRKIDLSLLQYDSLVPTGTVPVTINEEGNPSFTITENVAYDFIQLTEALSEAAKTSSMICFGTLVQRSPATRETLYSILGFFADRPRLLDINLRKGCYSDETILQSLRKCSIVKLNGQEVEVVAKLLGIDGSDLKLFAKNLLSHIDNIDLCLITLGEQGVFAAARDGKTVSVPGYKVSVADTIGAGDSFTAGFVAKFLAKKSLEECCEYGNRLGALAATKQGGMGNITRDEISSLKMRA
jgi:fructokinase